MKLGMWNWEGRDGEELANAVDKSNAIGRGILFTGTPGSGKTTAANVIVKGRGGVGIDCSDSEKTSALSYWREWLLPARDILLDEFGRNATKNDYGNKHDEVVDFVRTLYKAWKDGDWSGRLYIVTNMTSADIRKHYDQSLLDRLLEMCVVCKFNDARRVMANKFPNESVSVVDDGEPDDGYRWHYSDNGIDTSRMEFKDAEHTATRADYKSSAMALARLVYGFTGEECEILRCAEAAGGRMREYFFDLFVYANCGTEEQKEAFGKAIKAYSQKVFSTNAKSQSMYDCTKAKEWEDAVAPFTFRHASVLENPSEGWKRENGKEIKPFGASAPDFRSTKNSVSLVVAEGTSSQASACNLAVGAEGHSAPSQERRTAGGEDVF